MRGVDEIEPGEWLVALGSWVIQDGNYSDFALDEHRRFALEFYGPDLHAAESGVRAAVPRGNARYDITAEVVYRADDLLMLDFGLLAYSGLRSTASITGSWCVGPVILGVDPFSFFEVHARRANVPPAVYVWTITGIWRQTAPFIPVPGSYLKKQMRDPAHLGYAALERTHAWSDDAGHADYTIRCRLENDPAGFRL